MKQIYITVKSVIEELKKADPNAVVLIQRDPEGNGIHHLLELSSVEKDHLVGGKPSITFVADYRYLEEDEDLDRTPVMKLKTEHIPTKGPSDTIPNDPIVRKAL